jgi:SAM-dependent methyltransferase
VCDRCGSGLTTPVVPAADLAALYPEGYGAHGLPSQLVLRALATALFRLRYRRALRRLPLRVLRERDGGSLLDVGSGRGDLGVVAGELGWDVTAIEPSAAAAEAARRRGVRSVTGTLATALVELEPPYDAVVFQHSLEHVADPAADLARARSLLRPGGGVLVTVPNFGSWQARRFGATWFHLDLPRHRAHFTALGLATLLERAGFEDATTSTSTSADGLPMSLEYRLFGGSRANGIGRYAEMAAAVLLTPLSAAVGGVAGDGDVLHAVAVAPVEDRHVAHDA